MPLAWLIEAEVELVASHNRAMRSLQPSAAIACASTLACNFHKSAPQLESFVPSVATYAATESVAHDRIAASWRH
eukprot:4688422-Amphidinium_carterae.1